ncbi:MAG TPA: tRNA 2-thiocytidine biosynthesis TtcA family protein [Desulfomicrobiaceae bacterium]|nr:tRNA 2-thiocytidine biosynthesis TtcA family protein [Desulfomicrobiaceae bacterium]
MAQWGKLKYAQKRCLGQSGKLIQDTGMLYHGARVGIAVSGGMDSFVLLQVMLMRQRILPFPFEIMVLHLNPGFDTRSHAPLADWLRTRHVPAHLEVTDFGPRAHSKENRKNSPCFFCAWHRRKRLFDLCRQYRLSHLAMGHNTDDLLSNFLMNMTHNATISGMSPKESYFKGKLTMIRPLLMVDKSTIRQACRQWALPLWDEPCPSADSSKRSEMTDLLRDITGGDKRIRKNIANGLRRWQLDRTRRIS